MGCGASNDAQPLPIVPAAAGERVDPTKPHKVQVVAPGSALPAGLASFKNGPSAPTIPGTASKRGSVFEDDLPPLKTTPKGSKIAPSTAPPAMSIEHANAPPGSQIQGLNYCTPEFFPTHMVSRTAEACVHRREVNSLMNQ
jgi:hypothetical protein